MQCLKRLKIPGPSFLIKPRTTVEVPTAPTYPENFDLYIQSKSLKAGEKLHQRLLKNNASRSHPLLLEKLTYLYVECGKIEYARKVFDKIPDPSVVLWNLMIRVYAWNGPFVYAIHLYNQMLGIGVVPTKYTFTFALKACSSLLALEDGEKVHGHAIRVGLDSDAYVSTALVHLYAKCVTLAEAEKVFRVMPCRDVVAWNAMIAGYSLHGLYDDMIELILEMQKTGISPNSSTLVAILPTLGQARALNQGKTVHGYCVRRHFSNDVVVGTGLLDMYAKSGCVSYAEAIFNSLRIRNEVTWSAMLCAYVSSNHMKEALELYDQLLFQDAKSVSPIVLCCALKACTRLMDLCRGRRIHCHTTKIGNLFDVAFGNTLLSMYAKCGALNDAITFFHEMNLKDVVSYSAIISGFVQNGNSQKALDLLRAMRYTGIQPEETTMLGILPACSHLAALQHGVCAHGYAIVTGFVTDVSVCNALIDMYAKCGRVSTARAIFDRMHKRNIVSWNSIIAGYGIQGLGLDSLFLFNELKSAGLKLDDITFISLLNACSHSGLVAEGKFWFNAMVSEFGIIPRIDHYICMVDLLGRSGYLEEATEFIENMPLEPDIHIWNSLLGASRIHKNIELGEKASKKILSLGPEGTGTYVLLSNIYSCARRWEDAASVRIKQRELGFKKSPGCSWIEINGICHAFANGDRSHPRSPEIYQKLDDLSAEMKSLGYCAMVDFVMQDVQEEEKEHILLCHSEKLAIAFGIISLSRGKPLLVTKNLRICGDCHEAIKYTSIIVEREITVRDANRFHHFKNGVCSCQDFW